jgi:hypothetical protein
MLTNVHETELNGATWYTKVERNVVRILGFEQTCGKTFMPATFNVKSTLFSKAEIGCLEKLQQPNRFVRMTRIF